MILKILLLVICAALLFICYKPTVFAEKILKMSEDRITERLTLKLKVISLCVSMVLFICTMIFVK